MGIPKEIEKNLATDEVIEKEFHLRGRFGLSGDKVYASSKRLFIVKEGSIKDIEYSHISRIESSQGASVPAVVLGLLCIAAGVTVRFLVATYWWAWVLVGLGLILFILGLIRTQRIELFAAGLRRPEILSGHRSGLDSLFRLVREK